MHELSIARNIVEVVGEVLGSISEGKVKSVKVRVGDLSNVVPESLHFCFRAMVTGTSMEKAELEIERIPAAAHCQDCGLSFYLDHLLFKCPGCGSLAVDLVSGNELDIVEVETDEIES